MLPDDHGFAHGRHASNFQETLPAVGYNPDLIKRPLIILPQLHTHSHEQALKYLYSYS